MDETLAMHLWALTNLAEALKNIGGNSTNLKLQALLAGFIGELQTFYT
jgi:hypothetical protein